MFQLIFNNCGINTRVIEHQLKHTMYIINHISKFFLNVFEYDENFLEIYYLLVKQFAKICSVYNISVNIV